MTVILVPFILISESCKSSYFNIFFMISLESKSYIQLYVVLDHQNAHCSGVKCIRERNLRHNNYSLGFQGQVKLQLYEISLQILSHCKENNNVQYTLLCAMQSTQTELASGFLPHFLRFVIDSASGVKQFEQCKQFTLNI